MSEAIKLVLDYAFNEMKIARIEGFTNDKNLRAFSLMEKSGFVRDTDLENEIRINEPDFVNMVAYKLEK
jgi:RimJ/RimL family protein N-acetyltransferase